MARPVITVYFKAKNKGRNFNKVAGYFRFNKRLSVNFNLKPEFIEIKNNERIPLIVKAFFKRLKR